MTTIQQTVIAIIAKEGSLDPAVITLDSTLQALDVHSLDGIQIIFEIEDAFDIVIPQDEAQHATGTVGELVAGVERLVAEKAQRAGAGAGADGAADAAHLGREPSQETP